MDSTLLRIGIAIAGVVLIAAIYFFGRPRKPGQGRRVGGGFADANRGEAERIEPTLGEQIADELAAGQAASQSELDRFATDRCWRAFPQYGRCRECRGTWMPRDKTGQPNSSTNAWNAACRPSLSPIITR